MPFNTLFPIGIATNWQSPTDLTIPDPCLKNWLLDTGSLTERLQSQCRTLELTLIGQDAIQADAEEQTRLGRICNYQTQSWQVREILLSAQTNPWVFARSVLPDALCRADLAELGNKPLGKILFNDNRFVRQPFEIACIQAPHPIFACFKLNPRKSLWARRSIFAFKHFHIMVAEVFLPDSPAFKMHLQEQPC